MTTARYRRLLRPAVFVLGGLATTSCGGGDGPIVTPGPPTPTPAVTAVAVSPSNATVRFGQPVTLTASVTATGGASTEVSWSSDNGTVATVPENGGSTVSVTTLAPGTATITARSRVSASVAGSAVITVQPRPDAVAAVTLSPSQPFSLPEQATADIQATASGIEQGATLTYSFTSSNPAIATVAARGTTGAATVTAVTPGTGGPVQITASVTGTGPFLNTVTRTASVAVTVTALPLACTGFTLEPRVIALAPRGVQSIVGSAAGRAAGSAVRFTYVSSNVAVATVDSLGQVTAVAPGSATIAVNGSCTGQGLRTFTSSETVPVTVTSPPALLGVSLAPTSATIRVGQQTTLVPSFERAVPGIGVTCSFVSDSAAIATVNAAGVVTGVAPGRAPITTSCTGTGAGFATTTLTASALVTVTAATNACTGVTITPNPAAVTVGSTTSYSVVVATAGAGVTVSNAWTSSAPTVATVTGSSNVTSTGQVTTTGVVTGIAPGTAVITYNASCSGGGFTSNQVQTTASVLVTGITVPPITNWSAYLVGGPVRADVLTRGWAASATTWFVAGSDDVATAGGGLWRTTDGGVTWSKIIEVSSRVTAITGTSATDVWFGTADGRIFQYNGSSAPQRRGTSADGVFGLYVSGTTAFALVGPKRLEQSVAGGPFTLMTNTVLGGLNLYHVNGSGASDVFAAGDSGVVLRYNGTAWSRAFTLADQPLIRDIYVAGPGAVFVGGTACPTTCVGRIARLAGSVWVNETGLTIPYVDAIAGSSSNDVYVLNFPGDLRRFNGTSWSTINTTDLRWDDGRRLVVPLAGSPVIVGSFRASVQQFTNGTWTTRSVLPDLYDAASTTGGTSYYVGDTRTIIGADAGGVFAFGTTSQNVLYTVHPVSETELYAGGVNAIVRVVDGLEVGTTPVGYSVLDIHGAGGTTFAVGTAGGMSRLTGSTWSSVASGTGNTLRAVWMASPRFGFAAGESGTLLRYNGTAWQNVASPTTSRIIALWGADSANAYLAIESGLVLRWNGTAWSSFLPADGLRAHGGGANSTLDQYLATTTGLRRINNGVASTIANPSLAGVTLPWTMSVLTNAGLAAAVGPNGVVWTGRPATGLRALRAGARGPDVRSTLLRETGGGNTLRVPKSAAGARQSCGAPRC